MKQIRLALHDQAVEVCCPASILSDLQLMLGDCVAPDASPRHHVSVVEDDDGRYTVSGGVDPAVEGLTRGDLPTFLMETVLRALIYDLAGGVALHAGLVGWHGASVLVAGPTGSGKSSIVAWFVEKGFRYLSDEVAVLLPGGAELLGLPRALVVKPGVADKIARFSAFDGGPKVPAGTHVMLRPGGQYGAGSAGPCRLIVFPRFDAVAEARIAPLSAAQAGLKLMECNLNERNLPDGGFGLVSSLARRAPAVSLSYGDFDQLDGVLDTLARLLLESELEAGETRRLLSALARPLPAATPAPTESPRYEIPAPTPRKGRKKLTIGMATYDDYDGVYFSLQALRMYHPEVQKKVELLVIDNHPDGPCGGPLKALENHLPNYRYVPAASVRGTAVRNLVFDEAEGDFVLCMDSHVFIVRRALKRLLDYFAANPDTKDLLQGPLLYDDLEQISTHFHPEWRAGMYGTWQTNEAARDPDAPPFEIPMQGLGLFACRRAAWPGFNPKFRGFGGEEGYIHEKIRRAGGRTLCLPFLRWVHRFNRPMGIPYVNTWDDRIRNYMIGFTELGLPTAEIESHFREFLGEAVAGPIFARIKAELEA